MSRERFKLLPGVALILKQDSKILLMKRLNTGWQDGLYALPGGGVENGETVKQAISREVNEELGITVLRSNLNVLYVQHHREPDCICFFMEVKKWSGKPCNMEPNKCEEICWFEINNLPDSIVPNLKNALKNINKGVFCGEYGW